MTFLGTGTSMGVPTLGCNCAVCTSTDPQNDRTRASVMLQYGGHTVLVDTGPDFRQQARRARIRKVDAVLYTHGHADHVLGMDDLRPLTFGRSGPVPLYADDSTADTIERVFDYTFRKTDAYPTRARVQMHRLSSEPGTRFDLFGASVERINVQHGRNIIAGYRFGQAAYITDMSDLPEETYASLHDVDVLVLSTLRREPHPSHAHLEKSIAVAQRIGAKQTYFTHISHDLDHSATCHELPAGMALAYDGLSVEFDIA